MSQRKPTGAVGSPMDDSLATVRVVVTDTRAARIPHTGRRLVSSQSDAFVPTQRRPGSQARNGTYSLRAGARSAVPRRRTAPIVCALARGLRCRDEERHLPGACGCFGRLLETVQCRLYGKVGCIALPARGRLVSREGVVDRSFDVRLAPQRQGLQLVGHPEVFVLAMRIPGDEPAQRRLLQDLDQ